MVAPFPFQITRSSKRIEIVNAAKGSHLDIAMAIGMIAPVALFFFIDKGAFFFMLPLALFGLLAAISAIFSWDVIRTVIDSDSRSVQVTSARSIFRRAETIREIPFREFSLIMVGFEVPNTTSKSPGSISLTLTGRLEHIRIFLWAFYGDSDQVQQSFMPTIREIAAEIAGTMGIRVTSDIPPHLPTTQQHTRLD